MLNFLLASFLVFAVPFTSWAEEHDHDHGSFPENALLILEGQDAVTKEDCFLFVTDIHSADNSFSAEVSTSYSHSEDKPAAIRVQLAPNRADVLMGTGANGKDQIAIFLGSNVLDLRQAQFFNLKWWHGNHFHTQRCVNLQPHTH